MFFILKFCAEFEFSSVYVNVTDFLNLTQLAAEIVKCENSDISVFLFNCGTEIDDDNYLYTLENWTELFICKQCQKKKLKNYFDVKQYLEIETCIDI